MVVGGSSEGGIGKGLANDGKEGAWPGNKEGSGGVVCMWIWSACGYGLHVDMVCMWMWSARGCGLHVDVVCSALPTWTHLPGNAAAREGRAERGGGCRGQVTNAAAREGGAGLERAQGKKARKTMARAGRLPMHERGGAAAGAAALRGVWRGAGGWRARKLSGQAACSEHELSAHQL
eukprot:353925-Chlamydomonas_euryale.AAC.2